MKNSIDNKILSDDLEALEADQANLFPEDSTLEGSISMEFLEPIFTRIYGATEIGASVVAGMTSAYLTSNNNTIPAILTGITSGLLAINGAVDICAGETNFIYNKLRRKIK